MITDKEKKHMNEDNNVKDDEADRNLLRWIATIAIMACIPLWAIGTFDKVLVNVGLNAKDCITNMMGATFCGNQADQYKDNVKRMQDDLQRDIDELYNESP